MRCHPREFWSEQGCGARHARRHGMGALFGGMVGGRGFGWRGFAIAGAAIETCLCCAYGVSQFFGWQWGRYQRPSEAPRFTLLWLATFVTANLIVLTGIDPLNLVEYAVVSSIIVIPFSYLPLLLIANDRKYMGTEVNGRLANILGVGSYAIVVVAAIAAVPLYVLTSGGRQ